MAELMEKAMESLLFSLAPRAGGKDVGTCFKIPQVEGAQSTSLVWTLRSSAFFDDAIPPVRTSPSTRLQRGNMRPRHCSLSPFDRHHNASTVPKFASLAAIVAVVSTHSYRRKRSGG